MEKIKTSPWAYGLFYGLYTILMKSIHTWITLSSMLVIGQSAIIIIPEVYWGGLTLKREK
jgi:hypothetical protein